MRVDNAPRTGDRLRRSRCSTWQGGWLRPSPLHPLPRAASGGSENRTSFRTFGLVRGRCPVNPAPAPAPLPPRSRSGSQKRQRNRNIPIPVDADEFASIEAKARAAGMSRASFGRAAMLGSSGPRARRSPPVNAEALARAVSALNKAGSNLNQIARTLNAARATGTDESLAALAETREAVARILELVGRSARP